MLKKIFDNFNILSNDYGQLDSIEQWSSIDDKGNEIPWYTYPSIEYLSNLDFSKKKVFEFGSGNSSLFWAKRAEQIVSVESDKKWFDKIRNKKLNNQEIILVKEDSSYENCIKSFKQTFDVIIIDGKRRVKCTETIYDYLNMTAEEGCMIILDNSDWYKNIAKYLREKLNFIQIDFSGFGPINNYTWTTSIFLSRNFNFKPKNLVQPSLPIGGIQNNSEELEILKDYLYNNIKQKNITIYGFGNLGKNLYLGLKDSYNITNIIDNQLFNQQIDNLIIKNKDNFIYKNEYIIITVLNKIAIAEITSELESKYKINKSHLLTYENIHKNYFDKMNNDFKRKQTYELCTYAQDSEDTILKRIFEYKNLSEGGFYIDVGAHHPIRYSNTYFFYKKNWRGINIDALPHSMEEFEKYRPEDINLEYAISNKEEVLEYYQFNEPAYNSFDKELSLSRVENKQLSIINTTEIKTKTLNSLLNHYMPENKDIDFLSIDVEGFEFNVLKSNNWEKYRPKVILIEVLNVDIKQMQDTEIYQFLTKKNYRYFAKTVSTHFFIEKVFFNKRFSDFNLPDILQIEITNICNANCIFCAYQFDQREKGTIDFNLLKNVIKQYKELGGETISLTPFAGEIFIDKDILEKINFIHKYKFKKVFAYTNALLLHKFSYKKIVNSGLTELYISLAPLSEETYIEIFRNHNYKQLLKNLFNLLETFNKTTEKTLKKIHLEFRSNISLDCIKKLPDFKKYIQPHINNDITISSMDFFDSWMGKIDERDLLKGMKIKNHNFKKNKPCRRLNTLQVMANGDTRICGCRYNHNSKYDIFTIGNIKEESLLSLYNKQKVTDLKNSFYKENIPQECELCSWYESIE